MFNFGEMQIYRDKGKVGMINQQKHQTYLQANWYNK